MNDFLARPADISIWQRQKRKRLIKLFILKLITLTIIKLRINFTVVKVKFKNLML